MKRPIDPNLSNNCENDFLPGLDNPKAEEFNLNDFKIPERDVKFTVVENKNEKPQIATVKTFAPAETEKTESKAAEMELTETEGQAGKGETHHHSSSGSSHHHSSSGSSHHHSSSSSSHHHHHSSKKKKMPLAAKIAIAIVIILLLAVVVVAATFFILKSKGETNLKPVVTEDVQYQETIEYGGHTYKFNEDVVALGFIGVDQRELNSSDDVDYVGAADADIVIAIDTKTGKTKVIAIPRDTMVDIDINSKSGVFLRSEKAQLCLAYAFGDGEQGSIDSTISAMSRVLLNVPINKYFVLDLDGIKPLNDAIGGVTVESLYDFTNYGIHKGQTVTLKGDMAEVYVRIRDMVAVDASLNRTQRQIQYIKAYAQQVLPAVVNDFNTISTLYNTASDYSKTNLTLSNATYLGSLLLSKGVTNFESYTLEGEMIANINSGISDIVHAEFYPDDDNVMQTVLDVFYTQMD